MKINSLLFNSFAGLENKKIDFYPRFNVLYGLNEMGKSSISKAILHLLYGIYPTNKERNPYVNWFNQTLDYQGDLQILDKKITLRRHLKSSPMGEIILDDQVKRIGNQSISNLQNIPMWLYDELYCLDTRSIDAFSDNAWERINENLIFSYHNSRINNPQRIIESLEAELKEIWRESNRGRFKLKTLKEDIRKSREKLRTLKGEYNQIKDALNEMHQLEIKVTDLQKHCETIELKEKSVKRLLPLSNLMLRKVRLEKQLISMASFKALSNDHLKNMNRLENQLDELKESKAVINKRMSDYEMQKKPFNTVEEKILLSDKAFMNQAKSFEGFLDEFHVFERLSKEVENIWEKYNRLFYKIFNQQMTHEDFKVIYNTSLDNISFKEQSIFNYLYAFIMGLLILMAYLKKDVIYVYILMAFLSGLIMSHLRNGGSSIQLNNRLSISKNDIGLFRELKAVEYEYLRMNKKREKSIKNIEEQKESFFHYFNKYLKLESFEEIESKLHDILFKLDEKKENNQRFDFLLSESQRDLSTVEERIKKVKKELDQLTQEIMTLSPNNLEESRQIFKENLKRLELIDEINSELQQLPQYQLLVKAYNQMEEEVSLASIDQLQSQRKNLEDQKMTVEKRLIQLKERIENENISDEISNIQSTIHYLKNEKEKTIHRKNELLSMIDLLKKSNEAFKKDFEPAVIKKANGYFSLMTESKYDKILIDRETHQIKIAVQGTLKNCQEGFSRGTLDQLFLALRLSVIEYYEDEIKLPIVFDEFFSNWDNHRLKAFLSALESVVNDRQVVFMTCKTDVAERLKQLTDAKLIQLNEVKE